MKPTLLSLLTVNSEQILGDYLFEETELDKDTGESLGYIYLLFPIRIMQQSMVHQSSKVSTIFVPQLMLPFGKSNVHKFRKDFFVHMTICSDYDRRYYNSILEEILAVETKRKLLSSSYFDQVEYAYKKFDMHHGTTTIQ
jgi:hypothetical protein